MRTKTMVCVCFTLLMALLVGCGTSSGVVDTTTDLYDKQQSLTGDEIIQSTESAESIQFPKYHDIESEEAEEIKSNCQEIALLCNDLMANGEKETSSYFPYDTTLIQSAVDDVEVLLSENGYPVINSDSNYPEYLEHSDGLKHFFELADKGESAQQSIVTVSSYNSISYTVFQYADDMMYYINATATWDGDGKFTISEPYKIEMIDWGMTYNGYFYYQMYPLDRHWRACMSIRLEPVDKELYDLYTEYLTPVGYPSSVVTLNWDSSDYGNICFNDLFESLYWEQYGDYVYDYEYEYFSDLKSYLVPADIFESAILPHFGIALDEFRTSTLYLSDYNAYPWQSLNCSNIIYCPVLTPEIIECRDNEDGTFTLVVEVLCFEYKCFPMFAHEITIRPNSDGGFQYVSNQVTYVGEQGVPDTTPRIEEQRR